MSSMARAERRRRERLERKQRERRTPPVRGMHGGRAPLPMWNGEPCEARRCVVESAESLRRNAVEVRYAGRVFYLDDEPYLRSDEELESARALRDRVAEKSPAIARGFDLRREAGFHGWGWAKLTHGRGSPRYGHRELRVRRVVHYIDGVQIVEPEEPRPAA